jgi:hypothetical protein
MRCLAAVVLMTAVALPASAQSLKMSFSGGMVSLEATQVPVRTILAEWARLGGTKVVNGEKVTGAPLTIRLVDTPESQALEIILRNVAGYMAAPRAAATGASLYDRILVLPTSAAPAPANASTSTPGRPGVPGNNGPGNQRFIPPRPMPPSIVDEDEAPPDGFDPSGGQPVFSFPQPPQGQPGNIFQPANGQPTNIFQPVGQPTPFGTPMSPPGQQPAVTINPGQPGTVVYPGQPQFGIFGSPTPGVVQPPPPGPQPGVTVIRPPGQ